MRYVNLLDQFRSFYFRNYPDDMETQIEYFGVFGGLGWEVDTTQPLPKLIERLIFENFEPIHKKMQEITLFEPHYKRLLIALATGDRRIFSAFNRAGLNNGNGGAALNFLEKKGIIQIEYSREALPDKSKQKLKREESRHRISDKVLFTQPFIRFWFYFIEPYLHDMKEKNYTNILKNFQEQQNNYTSLVFEELSEILLNYNLRDSHILTSGSYWDAKVEIDILTFTKNNKIYASECKWKNHKVTKNELHKLMEKCEKLQIEPTQIVLFSKRGFSKELLSMQGKELALYSCDDFRVLLKSSSKRELLQDFIL